MKDAKGLSLKSVLFSTALMVANDFSSLLWTALISTCFFCSAATAASCLALSCLAALSISACLAVSATLAASAALAAAPPSPEELLEELLEEPPPVDLLKSLITTFLFLIY